MNRQIYILKFSLNIKEKYFPLLFKTIHIHFNNYMILYVQLFSFCSIFNFFLLLSLLQVIL
jgi:hypothetical protein